MRCISTVNFAIMLNGQPGSKFASSRCFHQGDLLSLCLFLFVSEVLSSLIQRVSDTKKITGVQISPLGRVISHIFFAYDTLIFLKANKVNCTNMVNLIKDYYVAFEQQVNLLKSSVFFGANIPMALM